MDTIDNELILLSSKQNGSNNDYGTNDIAILKYVENRSIYF